MLNGLDRNAVIIESGNFDKEEALELFTGRICEVYDVDNCDQILSNIIERETRLSTGIGLEVAVPHCRVAGLETLLCGVMLVPAGIEYKSVDGRPVKLVIMLISPADDVEGHLSALSEISNAVSDETTRSRILAAKDSSELYEIIQSL